MELRNLLIIFILIVCLVFLVINQKQLFENFKTNINNPDINNNIGDDLDNISGDKPDMIPKRIIQIWKTWTNKNPSMFKKYSDSLKKMNPTYEYLFFKDLEIDDFLKKEYPDYYDTYNRLPLNIQKVDFFRYIAIYHFGGFYFDLDIMALQPLDDLLKYDSVFPIDEHINDQACSAFRFNNFCARGQYFLLGQYGLAAKPKNLFIKYLIDNIHNNVNNYIKHYVAKSEEYVYKTTGPDFVTLAYLNFDNSDRIHILDYPKRQYFGKYAKHDYIGTWKSNN
uniref:Glycosyltransferase n=1 Tax=viral metagenome TaxID=1070528 RepID=A0A6C0DR43_9ZZZZ